MSPNGSPSSSSTPRQQLGRPRPRLRQATLIVPKTGERIKKAFTLRNARVQSVSADGDSDREPLLTHSSSFSPRKPQNAVVELVKSFGKRQYVFWTSRTGIGILKCSIAYILGSLATFVPAISGLLGRNDGKHVVATVTVYFHPARSAGSMAEAVVIALLAFAYAAAVGFSSMAVTVFFANRDMIVVGYIIVLIVFCGGGLGLVGWTKQRLGNPLVNVGCSLTSLALITVLTKEGAVQTGNFSYDKILQVLKMVAMGVFFATIVNFLLAPQLARKAVRNDFERITDLQEEMLTTITRSFLSGQEQDIVGPSFTGLSNRYRSTFNALLKDLREAKFEHYVLGSERIHRTEKKLVKCIERLGQSLTGLRSAAETQFELLRRPHHGVNTPVLRLLESISGSPSPSRPDVDVMAHLQPITEEPEDAEACTHAETTSIDRTPIYSEPQTSTGPSEIFSLFIRELGPSMKSLAYTLKGVLSELPFEPGSEQTITINNNFRLSLVDAKQLFAEARKKALDSLYRSRTLARATPPEAAADYEEVAASCGHFSSSMQDFAEDTIAYLDILEELDADVSEGQRSWTWLYSWHKWRWVPRSLRPAEVQREMRLQEETAAQRMSMTVPSPKLDPSSRTKPGKQKSRMYHTLWKLFGFLRREDVRFATKVGIGAILYAMFSFIPETQPIYAHWRGEWGLLSYMLVCSMTIGASNTTGLQRFLGTCLGALLAIAAWSLGDDSAWILGTLGWLVSLGCFYIIVGLGKGPMGRFILLTYNLSALYAYSLSVKDDDDDDDEGGISPEIWEIVLHRVVAVLVGCLWGLVVTRVFYPISARKKLRQGMSLLWLRMGLIWKRDPLSILTDHDEERNQYMDIRESLELQRFLGYLEGLRESASHEFELRGPFPNDTMRKMLEATRRMMGAFVAMNTIIVKDLKASTGETELLKYTKDERLQLSARVSHLFSVLASSMQIAYPITDAVPNIEYSRDRFLAKLFQFRKHASNEVVADEDYELLYAYALVTGQIAAEIDKVAALLEDLYGIMDEESLRLQ